MPADLTIDSIKLPSQLRAPCPVVLLVFVKNIGSSPANPVPFLVTIDLGPGDAPGERFEVTVVLPENQVFSPGLTIRVPVSVRFPCTSPVTLRATVDRTHQITNNPGSLTLTGLMPTPVPWLVTTLRVA